MYFEAYVLHGLVLGRTHQMNVGRIDISNKVCMPAILRWSPIVRIKVYFTYKNIQIVEGHQ